jgi:hypothetical protein
VAPVFIRSLDWFGDPWLCTAADLTPLESFYLRIGTGPSPLLLMEKRRSVESMNRKKRAGKPAKGSAEKKVDWKALKIVHPDAAGIDVGGREHWVATTPGSRSNADTNTWTKEPHTTKTGTASSRSDH